MGQIVGQIVRQGKVARAGVLETEAGWQRIHKTALSLGNFRAEINELVLRPRGKCNNRFLAKLLKFPYSHTSSSTRHSPPDPDHWHPRARRASE